MRKNLQVGATVVALLAVLLYSGQATRILAGTTGTVSGIVTDDKGARLADVAVKAIAPSSTANSSTGPNGFYALVGLPPDTYVLTFSKPGYAVQSRAGVTVTQDQTVALNVTLSPQPKSLGTIAVRATTSLIQATQTASKYTVTGTQADRLNGVPQQIFEGAVIGSLPGVFFDNVGGILIRGGALNEVGYQLDGVENTEPVTGQFINSLALNGVSRLVVSTGGYDVSNGNTNAGIVNVVAKRGSYPGFGELTATVNAPNFQHAFSIEYGGATPDNRFSYYYSFRGLRQTLTAGAPGSFYPIDQGGVQDTSGNDDLLNLYYHFGKNNSNEIQYFADIGNNLFNLNYGVNPAITPYASNNNINRLITGAGLFPGGPAGFGVVDAVLPFPGQAGLREMTGFWDHEDENHTIQKINVRRQFSPTSFGEITGFRTQSTVNFLLPWDGGFLRDFFEFARSNNLGLSFDYSNQLDQHNLVSVGGETIFTKPNYYANAPTSALFQDPLACGFVCAALGLTGVFNPAAPQGYVTPIQAAQLLPASGPLPYLPDSSSQVIDSLHRNNAWLKDEFRPNDHWTIVAGVRWDQEVFGFPSNLAALNMQYFVDPTTGNFVDLPGPTIGTDVSRPTQISPRIAVSFQANAHDNFRASYGKNIEFVPAVSVESRWNISPLLAACSIASGCFTPLPGYSATCVNGFDPANSNARCNSISNLYQQSIEDLNTHAVAQFSPVLPQHATNADFSWSHDFGNGWETRVTPYWRKGTNYVVGNTPLLFTLAGTPVFGTTRNSNAGINQSTGVEFAVSRQVQFGLNALVSATYDNTRANYNSDFFPSTNAAALALNHLFHVSYVPAVQATANLTYLTRSGWKAIVGIPYESGYWYGVGTHTFVFIGNTPTEVLNTDLAESALGNSPAASAYYFTDPTNPGTITNPNITGSRGTPDGPDPGSLRGPQILTFNVTLAHSIGNGEIGVTAFNLAGNYSISSPFTTSNYVNNGLGAYGAGSGNANPIIKALQPYVFDLNPGSYITYPAGPARTYTFYYNLHI